MKKQPIAALLIEFNCIVFIHDEWEDRGNKVFRTCEGIRERNELQMIHSYKRLGELLDKGVNIAPSTWELILKNK